MRCFLTGSTGLVGQWLARSLIADKHEVVSLMRDDREPRPGGTAAYADIRDVREIERILFQYEIEVVYHLAAQTQVRISDKSPYNTFETNIRGTYSVLEACRAYNQLNRILVASSDKAYGDQLCPYEEDQPMMGRYPYDASKSCADIVSLSYHKTYGLPITIVRSSNIYGGGDLNWQRLVPAVMRFIYSDGELTLHDGGRMKRDFLHVNDVVRAYRVLADRPDAVGAPFNIGSGNPVMVKEMVDFILSACNCRKRYDLVDYAKNEIRDQWMSVERIQKLCGWKAMMSLTSGIRDVAAWYRGYFK